MIEMGSEQVCITLKLLFLPLHYTASTKANWEFESAFNRAKNPAEKRRQ